MSQIKYSYKRLYTARPVLSMVERGGRGGGHLPVCVEKSRVEREADDRGQDHASYPDQESPGSNLSQNSNIHGEPRFDDDDHHAQLAQQPEHLHMSEKVEEGGPYDEPCAYLANYGGDVDALAGQL